MRRLPPILLYALTSSLLPGTCNIIVYALGPQQAATWPNPNTTRHDFSTHTQTLIKPRNFREASTIIIIYRCDRDTWRPTLSVLAVVLLVFPGHVCRRRSNTYLPLYLALTPKTTADVSCYYYCLISHTTYFTLNPFAPSRCVCRAPCRRTHTHAEPWIYLACRRCPGIGIAYTSHQKLSE